MPAPTDRPTCHAAVFDLDGTLLDTLADLAGAANAVLRSRGFPEHPADAYKHFIGNGMLKLVERILPPDAAADPALCEVALAEYLAVYGERFYQETRPYPGVEALVGRLHGAGIALAVLSNKRHALTQKCIRAGFPGIPFAPVLGQREGVPRKPDPSAALEIAGELGLSPERCAFVGDSSVDILTARNAGMVPVGVTWGFRTVEELTEAGAEILIDHPDDLTGAVRFEPAAG